MKNSENRLGFPNLGLGVGLRSKHFPYLMNEPDMLVDWFEIISENFLDNHGYGKHVMLEIAKVKPMVMHGVSMNIGSKDPLNIEYLKKLKTLAHEVQPVWISDHLCWTGIAHHNSHDLLPLPLNEESLIHVIKRVQQVQDFLERPLILENPSTYMEFEMSTMTEWDYLTNLVEETNCGLLLDVNNVYVSSFNHGYDPEEYIKNLPHQSIVQIHLAGPTHAGDLMIDTHDQPVPKRVWELYKLVDELTGGVSTLLEWDANIPEYPELVEELNKAKKVLQGNVPETAIFQSSGNVVSTPIGFHNELV